MSRAASWNLGTLNSTTLDRLTKDVCKVKEKKKNLCSLAFLNWNDLHYFFYLLQIVNRQPWPIITTHTSSKSQENCHLRCFFWTINTQHFRSDQIRSVAQSCPTLCDPMNHSTPCLPVPHQLPEFTQTHVCRVSDAIQPSHPLSSPSPLSPNPSQHQGLFQWVNSLHEVAKVLEFQL